MARENSGVSPKSQLIGFKKHWSVLFSMHACLLGHFSCVRLFATLWITGSFVHGILRQEYWNGLPCPSPGDLLDPGMEPKSLTFPALEGWDFTTSC